MKNFAFVQCMYVTFLSDKFDEALPSVNLRWSTDAEGDYISSQRARISEAQQLRAGNSLSLSRFVWF